MLDWNNNPIIVSDNPCVNMFGKGPENTTRAECVHLQGYRQAATWYKCDLRPKHKRGLSGDHKVRYPACKRYEIEERQIMEQAKTLEDLVAMVGLNGQDETTGYVICSREQIWRSASVLWGKQGTERIEVYALTITAKPLRTIVMGEENE